MLAFTLGFALQVKKEVAVGGGGTRLRRTVAMYAGAAVSSVYWISLVSRAQELLQSNHDRQCARYDRASAQHLLSLSML